jgi:thiamine biosynthesis lipoprotein
MSLMRLKSVLAGLLISGLVSLALTGCQSGGSDPVIQTLSGVTMGTSYSVKVVASEDHDLALLKSRVQATLDDLESKMSTYRSDSELSRFNQRDPGQWFSVSTDTATVVNLGLEVSRQTGGAFDMTVGPLVNLWGFGPGSDRAEPPTDDEIDTLLAQIGYARLQVRLTPSALFKQQSAYLDLSAIAKGYAVDRVAELLDEEYQAYLVEVGGELRARGLKPDHSPWRIAVEIPQAGSRDIQRVISASDTAIATSGDYRNYFERDGVRYSHTIDPLTGRPISHGLASVTVLDPSCARSDALATAFMVMGDVKGLLLAEQMNLPVFFIVKQGEGFVEKYSSAFERYLIQ